MKDHFSKVPLDVESNLLFRRELLADAARSKSFRTQLSKACEEDPLFFFAAMCMIHEPRPKRGPDGVELPPVIPFVPWSHQIPLLKVIAKNLGYRDIGVEKSRGEGASWVAVLFAVHTLLFYPMSRVGIISKDERSVDTPGNMDSLIEKIVFTLQRLPRWMAGEPGIDWKRTTSDHVIRHLRTDSSITGYAATGTAASGGRARWFLMDELSKFPRPADEAVMASTQYVTESRLIVSTPLGASGAYYDVMHTPSSMVKVVLDWKANPVRNRGLYEVKEGKIEALDAENNPLPENYDVDVMPVLARLKERGFRVDGTIRSPWYDEQCDRPKATPQSVAQELDRDYGGSMYRIFGNDFFERAEEDIRRPEFEGIVTYNQDTLEEAEFRAVDDGPCKIWCKMDSRGAPPHHSYAAGVDICAGLGGSWASNSVLTVVDLNRGEQVFEFATNTIEPGDFADLCIAVCKWFNDAYLCWETNGPGSSFTRQVKERNYGNCYRRVVLDQYGKSRSKLLGWHTNNRSKPLMLSEVYRQVTRGMMRPRSDMLVKECGQYVMIEGKPVHSQSRNTQDDSSKGEAHGDRVIAFAVALQAAKDRPINTGSKDKEPESLSNPPWDCMAARDKAYRDSLPDPNDVWDGRWLDEPVGMVG